MMIRFVIPLACVLLMWGCRSTSELETEETTVACICGTPEADFTGCYCEDCVSGDGNPENPLCTCHPLFVEEDVE